jgi:hypothetical protein
LVGIGIGGEPEREITGETHDGRFAKGFSGVFDRSDVCNLGKVHELRALSLTFPRNRSRNAES